MKSTVNFTAYKFRLEAAVDYRSNTLKHALRDLGADDVEYDSDPPCWYFVLRPEQKYLLPRIEKTITDCGDDKAKLERKRKGWQKTVNEQQNKNKS